MDSPVTESAPPHDEAQGGLRKRAIAFEAVAQG
jgi:hypothetical protein